MVDDLYRCFRTYLYYNHFLELSVDVFLAEEEQRRNAQQIGCLATGVFCRQ